MSDYAIFLKNSRSKQILWPLLIYLLENVFLVVEQLYACTYLAAQKTGGNKISLFKDASLMSL